MSAELITNAERLADQTRNLVEFKNLSLPGIKEQVGQIARLIGREGIFSTYTLHDISHLDQMLRMLDWVIPKSTQAAMSPADWLLTVLAIYFHDLGMVTTTQEYEMRYETPEFVSWRNNLDKTIDGREYLARMNRMTDQEKEKFFFQEFIRKGHAQRIREWITGRHTNRWGSHVGPLAERIAEMLKVAPTRFREYLGIVCESHHRPDLDKTERYPLVARFGNDPGAVANVQYAAILLRTVDILHVTRDRTPSVMYEAIKFSDPKSVEEWDKQLGTFAVGPKGRSLKENDPESAVVVVSADFSEERPLFSLQEYIAYADGEIRQSNRWVEKSQENSDAKDYSFPWHQVEGDVRLEGVPPQSLRFELDRGQLLDLLVGHTIYNEPTVAVRELLQNGIDAVRYQAYLDARAANSAGKSAPIMGGVVICWDPKTRLLVIEDKGIGMDRDVIKHHLMSVGSSYYNTPEFEADNQDFVPISRFGIGILTCFMVSDDIEIVTFKEHNGFRIRMTSVKSTYLLRELEQGDPLLQGLEPHGTRVTLRLRDTVNVSKITVLNIVKHWVILPECIVEYREPGKDSLSVGFASLSEALRTYHARNDEDNLTDSVGSQVIVKQRAGSTVNLLRENYELAFAVSSGYFPEKSFAASRVANIPRVCIEGIRVSELLPGFERGQEQISAMLSVRGSRKFRTTVSRAGLEIDDAYRRAAALCLDMLFDHVRDEVDRISKKPGRPLSQAASGCQYLVSQLEAATSDAFVESKLVELAASQPSIVIERVETVSGKPITSRELLSPHGLGDLEEFWTIESRSVDSLGTISRDLGRELSLNEFLLALAPDVTQLRYSPILPDAQYSIDEVHSRHHPSQVAFSREHQQTAIEWALNKGREELSIDFSRMASRKFADSVGAFMRKEREESKYNRFFGGREFRWSVYVEAADFSGDDDRITAVRSRMGLVLKNVSDFFRIWRLIREVVNRVIRAEKVEQTVCALRIATSFEAVLSEQDSRTGESGAMIWRDQISQFREIIDELGIQGQLPTDLRDRMPRGSVFNATSFWRDWDRRVDWSDE